jgi:hypothetical protein
MRHFARSGCAISPARDAIFRHPMAYFGHRLRYSGHLMRKVTAICRPTRAPRL